MIKKTLSIVSVLLAIISLAAPTPIPVLAAQQWNQINLPGKIHAGTVPVVSMSPTFPSDHTIFTEDGTTLYESQDGGNTWNDMEHVHQNYSEVFYGGYSTTKTPTARIIISPDFDTSHHIVWTTIMANEYYQDCSTNISGNLTPAFVVKSTTPPPPPGPVSSEVWTILQGFAFGPDSTMYIAGGAKIYSGSTASENILYNPNVWNALCDFDSYVYDIQVSPNFSNDQTMIIQTDDLGVLISTNGGQNFTQTPLPVSDGYDYMRFSLRRAKRCLQM